jgi:hypothetical protein
VSKGPIRTFRYNAILDRVAEAVTPYDSRPWAPSAVNFQLKRQRTHGFTRPVTESNSLTALMLVPAFLKEISILSDDASR